jgi:hypothetical protein
VEDIYDDSMGKIALCATSAQLAKTTCVKEFGIGEELSFNFFGWKDEQLAVVCQLDKQFMRDLPIERFQRSSALCVALRQYWGVTAITFLAEGFHSFDPVATKNKSLSKAFIDDPENVSECLAIVHSEINPLNGLIETSLVSMPYKTEIGRTIIWSDLKPCTTGADSQIRESLYVKMFENILSQSAEESEEVSDEQFDWLIEIITKNGFHVQEL